MGVVERPRVTRDVPCSRMRVACGNRGQPTMERRKFIIGAGALATGSAAAVGTGAFSAAEVERAVNVEITDDSASLVGLEPGPETGDVVTTESQGNSNGSFTGDADALVIDLSNGYDSMDTGVNPDSTYQIGTPPESIQKPPYWFDRLLVTQENGAYEDDHAFSVRNQSTQEQNITVQFEGDNPSRSSSPSNVGLVLVDSDGNAIGDTDDSSNYQAQVTIDNVDAGESVYAVLTFSVDDFFTDNDIGGTLTVIAE